MAKLTKRLVDSLEPKAFDFFAWDDALAGFAVRVWPAGRKTYLVQYRAGRRTRRLKLGTHGAITVEQARNEARTVLGDVARGEDPAEEKATRRSSLTIRELCARYLQTAEHGLIMGKGNRPKKPSTLYVDRGRIERHILPLLGSRVVRELAHGDIVRFMRDVAAGKTATVEKTAKLRGKAVVEGGTGTAARTVGLLGGILSFAVSEGVIAANPAQGVERPAGNRRQRRLTSEEYRRLGRALAAAGEQGQIEQIITGIGLLALTGCRLGEIVRLQWSEIDHAGHCFRLSDSKEGASVRPVGQAGFDVLAGTAKRAGCPFVLPGARHDGAFGGMPGGWQRLARRAELSGVTPHTLRHSFASVAGDLGYTESTIAALLGHAAGSMTHRYIHHLDAVLVAAADNVARTISDMMAGN